MTVSWPYVHSALLAVPLGGHALATDTFSTDRSDRRMSLSLNGTIANDAPLTLGATGTGTELSAGAAIDELRVYSRELTVREAFELYARGTG